MTQIEQRLILQIRSIAQAYINVNVEGMREIAVCLGDLAESTTREIAERDRLTRDALASLDVFHGHPMAGPAYSDCECGVCRPPVAEAVCETPGPDADELVLAELLSGPCSLDLDW